MSGQRTAVNGLTLGVCAMTVLLLTVSPGVAQPKDEPEAPAGGAPVSPAAAKSGAEAAGGGEAAPSSGAAG